MQQVAMRPDGQLMGRGIHDAHLVSLRLIPGRRLDFCLRGADEVVRGLSLTGLSELGCQDLPNGTIVHDIHVWRLQSPSEAMHDIPRQVWHDLFGEGFSNLDPEGQIDQALTKYDGHYLMFLETSYRGQIAAICRQLYWNESLVAALAEHEMSP
jgi:hypothetical protein